jgi:hypothetical protein
MATKRVKAAKNEVKELQKYTEVAEIQRKLRAYEDMTHQRAKEMIDSALKTELAPPGTPDSSAKLGEDVVKGSTPEDATTPADDGSTPEDVPSEDAPGKKKSRSRSTLFGKNKTAKNSEAATSQDKGGAASEPLEDKGESA